MSHLPRLISLGVSIVMVVASHHSWVMSGTWESLPFDLRQKLEERAIAYDDAALRFTCTERIISIRYKDSQPREEDAKEFFYLLTRNEHAAGLRGYRIRRGGKSMREAHPRVAFPEPLLWSQIIASPLRASMDYLLSETESSRSIDLVTWTSSGVVSDIATPVQWSGNLTTDARTGNILELSAVPNYQEHRILARRQRYNQSTTLRFILFPVFSVVMKTAPKPIGYRLISTFGFEHAGLTYPTLVNLEIFQQVGPHSSDVDLIERRLFEYSDYRFFETEAIESLQSIAKEEKR